MTYVLVVSNIFMLVAMFIAAFWGFTYPKIMVDGYESGKSAFVAAFMCCLAGICLCGLNFQNYYLLVTYAVLHLLIMLNQLFSLLPFSWTRIPNYPLTGSISTQVYITLAPKILLVTFAFALAYKLRRDEKRYELASTGGYHHRLPCHIVPRSEPPRCGQGGLPPGSMFDQAYSDRATGHPSVANHMSAVGQPPPPPPHPALRMISSGPPATGQVTPTLGAPPAPGVPTAGAGAPPVPPTVPTIPPPPPPPHTSSTNQIIQTPPIYPLHRPSVTDVSITSPNRPLAPPLCPGAGGPHRPLQPTGGLPPQSNCPSSIGNHSSSCGGGLNDLTMLDEQETVGLTRTRSSGVHWRSTTAASYDLGSTMPSMTPTKWWPNSAKQYGSYYRDVYNPNF